MFTSELQVSQMPIHTQGDFHTLTIFSFSSAGYSLEGCTDFERKPIGAAKAENGNLERFATAPLLAGTHMTENDKSDQVGYLEPYSVYEPLRCVPRLAPPKRFYRTFWRSIVRRWILWDVEKLKIQLKDHEFREL